MTKKHNSKTSLLSIRCNETAKKEFKKIAADIGGDYEDAILYFVEHYEEIKRLRPPRIGNRVGSVV